MKRASIIVAVVLVVIAVVLLLLANFTRNTREEKSKQVQVESSVQVQQTQTKSESKTNKISEGKVPTEELVEDTSTNAVVNEQQADNGVAVTPTTSPATSTSVTETEVENTFSTFETSDLATLKESDVISEVMVLMSKKIVLLSNENSTYQLMPCLNFITADDTSLSYYVSQQVYDTVEVTDKLQVEYKVYKNSQDIEMPVIISVRTLN